MPVIISTVFFVLTVFVLLFVNGANGLTTALGVSGLSAMAMALLFAGKFRLLEFIFGGPDMVYQVHRWCGYWSVIYFLSHWMIGFENTIGVETSLSEFAEGIGVIPAILVTALGIISALRIVPYQIWKFSHFAMGPLFLIASIHAVFTPSPLTNSAFELFLQIIVSLGLIGWVVTLVNHIIPTTNYKVVSINTLANGVDIRLKACEAPLKSKSGQFAELSIQRKGLQEFHPFTIAGNEGDELRFVISKLGKFTANLANQLQIGDKVKLRSPRGQFLPLKNISNHKKQIWFAAGVGITPFLACLQQIDPNHKVQIYLNYIVHSKDDGIAIEALNGYVNQLNGFELNLIETKRHGRPTEAKLKLLLSSYEQKVDLYMCGPENLKSTIRKIWKTVQPKSKIYDEKFDFRAAI